MARRPPPARGRRGSAARTSRASTACSQSDAELVLEMDCDFSHDPADVPRLIAAVRGRRRPRARLALGRRRRDGQLGPPPAPHLARRLALRAARPRRRRPRPDRRLQVLPPGGARDDRPRRDRRARLRVPDRGHLPRAPSGVPRRRGADHVRRPPRRPVEDERLDRRRGDAPGARAPLEGASRPAVIDDDGHDASTHDVLARRRARARRLHRAVVPAVPRDRAVPRRPRARARRPAAARADGHRREPRRPGSVRRPLAPDGDRVRRRRAGARRSTASSRGAATPRRSRASWAERPDRRRGWDDAPRRPRGRLPRRRAGANAGAASRCPAGCTLPSPTALAARGVDGLYVAPGRDLGGGRPRAAASSSRPGPRRASRSRSRSPCSTRSPASRPRARSSSTRRRRSRRTRRAGSQASGCAGLRPAIYDGDTPIERRAHIRRTANAILTNPDMLHVGVLPHHDRWGDALHNLRVVVVDEAHVYRGVFGSHVANVLRRLRRLALAYGAEPGVRARVRDDRERRRARVAADRARRRGRRRRHVAAGGARGRPLEPRAPRRGARHARERARRRVAAARRARRPRAADDLLHEEPQGGRARPPLRERPSRRGDRTRGSRRTAPATRPSSDARSSGASSRASCSA